MKIVGEFSEAPWLHCVPNDWSVLPTRRLCQMTTGGRDTQDAKPEGAYPFFVRSQTVERIDTFSFEGEGVLTSGDGAGVGKIFHHHVGRLEFHQRVYLYHAFRRVTGRYFFYYLRELLGPYVLAGNAKSTVDSLRRPMLQRFPVSYPALAVQRRITDFLDKKTAAIDALIEKKQTLLTLLAETERAALSDLIFGGRDQATATLQQLAGTVPSSWKVLPIWAAYQPVKEQGFPSLTLLSVYRDHGVVPKSSRDDNHNRAGSDLAVYQRVLAGDVVFNKMKAWQGSVAVSPYDGIVSPDYQVLRPRMSSDLVPDFAHLLLRSLPYIGEYRSLSKGIRPSQWRLMFDEMRTIPMIVPPVEEQRRIVTTLEAKHEQARSLSRQIDTQLERLKEYRQALITAAVTGQLDIGEAA